MSSPPSLVFHRTVAGHGQPPGIGHGREVISPSMSRTQCRIAGNVESEHWPAGFRTHLAQESFRGVTGCSVQNFSCQLHLGFGEESGRAYTLDTEKINDDSIWHVLAVYCDPTDLRNQKQVKLKNRYLNANHTA